MKSPRFRVLDPTVHRFLRPNDVIAALPDLGPLHLQVRGVGGGIGKTLPRLEPIRIPGMDFAFDPDCGFGFALKELDAIHARLREQGREFQGTIDFDFAECPQGIGLHLPCDPERGAVSLRDLIGGVPTRLVDEEELADWRECRRRPVPMCPCCLQRAKLRARHPEAHPIFPILHHARSQGLTLECRMPAEHADLAVSLIPAGIEVNRGCIIVTDRLATQSLHLDMARLHALAIDVVRFDGHAYASLRLFDSRGCDTFRILCEDSSLATVWREMCEKDAP